MTYFYSSLFLFTALLLSACNQDTGGEEPVPDPEPNPINMAPVALPVVTEIDEDIAKTIILNGTDADSNTLSFLKVTDPEHGSISINGNTATYTPEKNYNGNDHFTYKVNDGTTDSNTATVSITVLAVNDAPTANAGNNQTGLEGKSFNLSGSGTDLENDTLTYRWQQTDTSGITAPLTNPQSATPSLIAPEVSTDTTLRFTLTIEDDNGGITTDTVDIMVNNFTIDNLVLRRCFPTPFPSGIALQQLTSLECNDVDLSSTDLSEFNKLPNLTDLSLSKNSLSDISVLAGMNRLTKLAVLENQVSDLSAFSGTNNLKELKLTNNRVRDISALSGINDLKILDLGSNQVNDLSPLLNFSKLTILNLSNNDEDSIEGTMLSDIDILSNVTTLTELDLSNNDIRNINAISGMTKLTTLNLSNNRIDNIQNFNIEDDVGIESLFSGMEALKIVNLQGNQLQTVRSLSSRHNPSLTTLDLSNNQLDTNAIRDISDLTTLTELYLSNNQIRTVRSSDNDIDNTSTFSDMTKLVILDLANNKLITVDSISLRTNQLIPSVVAKIIDPRLRTKLSLNVTNNCISDFNAFDNKTHIIINGDETDASGNFINQKPLSECRFFIE